MKKTASIIVMLVIGVLGAYLLFQNPGKKESPNNQPTNSPNQNMPQTSEVEVPGGLKTEILKEGTGQVAKNGDTVSVHYTGWLEDGTKFDSSVDRGTPFEFSLGAGQVISGWDKGVLGMKVGEKRKLTIPADLGYGANGTPGGPIPANATLIFEVELLGIK